MSYVDTQLIECSRASSEETKGNNLNNPAIFTNKLGDGITLNVGDVVSVERSFINGLGSGNQKTIQFKGVEIPQDPPLNTDDPNKYAKITYTEVVGTNPITDPNGDGVYRMGYFQNYETQEITEEIHLKDNEQAFTIGYYINSNHYPTYIQLPRRFNGLSANDDTNDFMKGFDTYARGLPAYSVQPEIYSRIDWEERHTEQNGLHIALKQVVDNSRFTLFVRDLAGFNPNIAGSTENLPVGSNWRLHPLWMDYFKYRERKSVIIKKGFNTPSEVADQFTRQLNKADQPELFRYKDTAQKIQIATTTINANTYKPFICPTAQDYEEGNYVEYLNENLENIAVLRYFNSFFYLGVKRPELFETGRAIPQNVALYADGLILQRTIVKNDPDQSIHTDMLYTKENLAKWRAFFEAQKNYPELWDYLDETSYGIDFGVNNIPDIGGSAFIHMNKWGNKLANTSPPNTATQVQIFFGSECMENGLNPLNAVNHSTMPLFLYYNQADKDIYYEPNAIPPEKFSMGFAKSVLRNGEYYIVFQPYLYDIVQQVGDGIPETFFTENNNNEIVEERRFGYDWNSTAYSSAFIIPYAGYTYKSFLSSGGHNNYIGGFKDFGNMNEQAIHTSTTSVPALSQIYIGANNPLVNFNEETNRFEISRLHTEEHVGNLFDGGDPKGRQIDTPIPRNPDENKVVYKMNPWVNPWGYSPTFLPYGFMFHANYTYPHTTGDVIQNRRDFYLNSNAIKPYSVFDTQGGIYFDNFGCNEREWGKSIWGIMGFSYNQFNSDVSPSNVLNKRVNFENKFSLNRPTTNAEIDTTDNKTWVVNEYGTPQYTNQVPTPLVLNSYTGNPTAQPAVPITLSENQTLYPPVVQQSQSLILSAENLSKQMLNPFYTIHSDILSNDKYVGGGDSGIKMPVVGVVDRYGAEGDFYFGNPSDLSFTITKQTTISAITTSIHDPDGTFAVIDDNSGVIYKVLRNRDAPPNVIADILKGKGK